MERIAFIGLGNMGANMARRLLDAGYTLYVHDLQPAAAAELVEQGANWCDEISTCVANADLLITSLPRPANVEAVMAGDGGALQHLSPGSIWMDMTTNDAAQLSHLAAQAEEQQVSVLDAPVTGAVDGARTGNLTVFVGGSGEVLQRVEPVLEHLGKYIHCGELGTGNAVKLVTNYLWFAHAAIIGEGLMLGKRAGVPLDLLWQAIMQSVGDSFVARHDVPSIFAGHYDPSFTLDLCLKDIALCRSLAGKVGAPIPLGEEVARRFELAAETYGGDVGELHVARLIEDAAGDDLRQDGDFTPHWQV